MFILCKSFTLLPLQKFAPTKKYIYGLYTGPVLHGLHVGMLQRAPVITFKVSAEVLVEECAVSYDLNASYRQPQNAVNPI